MGQVRTGLEAEAGGVEAGLGAKGYGAGGGLQQGVVEAIMRGSISKKVWKDKKLAGNDSLSNQQ